MVILLGAHALVPGLVRAYVARGARSRFRKEAPDHSEEIVRDRKASAAVQQAEIAQQLPSRFPEDRRVDLRRQDPGKGPELGEARAPVQEGEHEVRAASPRDGEPGPLGTVRSGDEPRAAAGREKDRAQRRVAAVAREPEVLGLRRRARREELARDLDRCSHLEARTATHSVGLHRGCGGDDDA